MVVMAGRSVPGRQPLRAAQESRDSRPHFIFASPSWRRIGPSHAQTIVAAAVGGQPPQLQDVRVAVPPPSPPSPPPPQPSLTPFPWLPVLMVLGLTVSSLAAATTAAILYLRPALRAAQTAAESTDAAAKDGQRAAVEMEKTALMFQQDLPVTLQEVQRAADEWELVGKQMNFLLGTVTRPVRPVERAAEWMEKAAGTTTASLSKRVASDTSSLANSLWGSINQFRQQMGWSSLTKADTTAAARLVDIGRQQQEARTWIAAWRSRYGKRSDLAPPPAVVRARAAEAEAAAAAEAQRALSIAARQRVQDEADLQSVEQMGVLLQQTLLPPTEGLPQDQRAAVEAVYAALARAQSAAEEAALSSSALEKAIEEAESRGALSSSDEDEEVRNMAAARRRVAAANLEAEEAEAEVRSMEWRTDD